MDEREAEEKRDAEIRGGVKFESVKKALVMPEADADGDDGPPIADLTYFEGGRTIRFDFRSGIVRLTTLEWNRLAYAVEMLLPEDAR